MDRAFLRYTECANSATSPLERMVSMLGMMCTIAAEQGRIVAFVGRGQGSDWPDPRIDESGDACAFQAGYGPNFPGLRDNSRTG